MCDSIVSKAASGSHSCKKHNSWPSVLASYSNELPSPNSDGVNKRESPSYMMLSFPGMCVSTAIDRVVNTMFPRRANVELTLSFSAQANELMLSPWRL
jgi:hypothetical protein